MSPEKFSGSVPPKETPATPSAEPVAPDLRREEYLAGHTGWVDESTVALLGIQRGRIDKRLKKAPEVSEAGSSHASAVYRDVAESSLNLMEPQKDETKPGSGHYDYYNPIAGFKKAHMTRRPDFGEVIKPNDTSRQPTSILQEQAAVRANLRVDALHKRRLTKEKFELVYGDYSLADKKALKAELASSNLTGSQKRAIKQASIQVRKANRSSERIDLRLHKSKYGQDLPGRVIAGREKAKEKSKITIQRTGIVLKNGAKSLAHEASSQTQKDYRTTKAVIEKARKKFADRKNKKSD